MIKNKVIIFPSDEDNKICDFLYQTAGILAKDNFVLLFQTEKGKSLKEIFLGHEFTLLKQKKNFFTFSPLLLIPFRRFDKIKKINLLVNFYFLLIIFFLNNSKVIVWFFFPKLGWLLSVVTRKLSHSHFDIIDFHFSLNQEKRKNITKGKLHLMKYSNTVSAISKPLQSIFQKFYMRPVKVVPQGFKLSEFKAPYKKALVDLPSKKPIVGFVGAITDRIDFNLMTKVVNSCDEVNFVFVGPKVFSDKRKLTIFNKMQKFNNFFYFPSQEKEYIPSIIKHFSVGMIPYDTKSIFNYFSYPMKLFEYFYIGIPVVSTKIPSLSKFKDLVFTSDESLEWSMFLKKVVLKPWPKKKIKLQRKLAEENSWDKKVKAASLLILQNKNDY